MKKLFTLFFFIVSANIFAQGNFTVEWESPLGFRIESDAMKLNSSLNVYHLAFVEIANYHNVRFYNGSTHALDFSWIWSGGDTIYGFEIDYIGGLNYAREKSDIFSSKFDINGDGINEIMQSVDDTERIVNPVNGNILYSTTEHFFIIDIDGDGYLEIIQRDSSRRIKIISTPAQSVSIENNSEIAKDYDLKQNYPNPFNPNTTIEYTLNKSSDVKIIIYDILGKEVNTLVDQKQISGTYKLNLSGNDLSSGTYFYRLIIDGTAESKKMILIK